MALCAFAFLAVSCFVSIEVFYLNPGSHPLKGILPYPQIFIPITHFLCAMGSLFIFIKPFFVIEIIIIFVESELTLLTGMEFLGIFLFYSFCTVGFIKNYLTFENKNRTSFFFTIHILTICSYFIVDWPRALVLLFGSIFFAAFYVWIYNLLRQNLTSFLPENVTKNTIISTSQPGTEIYLTDYNISDRQISFIYDCVVLNLSYKELSEKYYVSISTVKKEFAESYKHFGVSNIEELRFLLNHHKVYKERSTENSFISSLTSQKNKK